MKVYYFSRKAGPQCPAGLTVSKKPELPTDGDFGITEYIWGRHSLWFVDADNFTADERQAAWAALRHDAHNMKHQRRKTGAAHHLPIFRYSCKLLNRAQIMQVGELTLGKADPKTMQAEIKGGDLAVSYGAIGHGSDRSYYVPVLMAGEAKPIAWVRADCENSLLAALQEVAAQRAL